MNTMTDWTHNEALWLFLNVLMRDVSALLTDMMSITQFLNLQKLLSDEND